MPSVLNIAFGLTGDFSLAFSWVVRCCSLEKDSCPIKVLWFPWILFLFLFLFFGIWLQIELIAHLKMYARFSAISEYIMILSLYIYLAEWQRWWKKEILYLSCTFCCSSHILYQIERICGEQPTFFVHRTDMTYLAMNNEIHFVFFILFGQVKPSGSAWNCLVTLKHMTLNKIWLTKQ